MDERDDINLCCSGAGCDRRISAAVIKGAITAQPDWTPSYRVPLLGGEWVAYRGADHEVARVYCVEHRPQTVLR